MSEYWTCEADIRKDMFELSPFSNVPGPAPQPGEFMKLLLGKRSIFEDDSEEDDPQEDDPQQDEPQQEVQCLPVRGHPLLQIPIRKPGRRLANEQQTLALIREVSGPGYGNDLIEHALKAAKSDDDKDPKRMENVAFKSVVSKNGNKKSSDESDSSTSTYCDYISYSNASSSSGSTDVPNIELK